MQSLQASLDGVAIPVVAVMSAITQNNLRISLVVFRFIFYSQLRRYTDLGSASYNEQFTLSTFFHMASCDNLHGYKDLTCQHCQLRTPLLIETQDSSQCA